MRKEEKTFKDSAGRDDPERLKRWLYKVWRERHPTTS
jgi:hypothetical protein